MTAANHHVGCAMDFHISAPVFLKRGTDTASRDAGVYESYKCSIVVLRIKDRIRQKCIAVEQLAYRVLVGHRLHIGSGR